MGEVPSFRTLIPCIHLIGMPGTVPATRLTTLRKTDTVIILHGSMNFFSFFILDVLSFSSLYIFQIKISISLYYVFPC